MKQLLIILLPFIAYSFLFYGQISQIIHLFKVNNTEGIEIRDLLFRALGQVLFILSIKLKTNDGVFIFLSSLVLFMNIVLIFIFYYLNKKTK